LVLDRSTVTVYVVVRAYCPLELDMEMTMQLLPHQIEDAAFLASRRFAGCFSGMGSGKTLTALEAFRNSDATRALIIAPPIALRMWSREAERHCGVEAQILKTGKTKIADAQVVVCSYQIATARQQELFDWLRAGSSALICDESHALKSTKAKRTKAVLGRGGLAGAATHTWCLTGTPVTRWNDDLIPFLCRAAPEQLKQKTGGLSIEQFMLRYTVRQKRQFPGARFPTQMVVGSRNTAELRDILYGEQGCAVRRELADVWDAMPPITHNTYEIQLQMDAELRATLKELDKRSITEIAQQLQRQTDNGEVPLATVRRQIGEAKVLGAAEVLAERVEAGSGPVLAGFWHRAVGAALAEQLRAKGLRVGVLDGATSAAKKAELEDAFNAKQLDVLLGQIASMGVSLNLQKGGNVIVVVESDWSPAIMDQFYARLYRMGQQKHVHIDTLTGDTKLEQAVARIAVSKERNAAALNDSVAAK
jgi:SNF2 family DNA or RNA helicase